MICAIGDIHGCYDPLKALINWLQENIKKHCRQFEYIFIGDYIDRGPSSREVLDYLIDFDEKKTLLMGNHEDMLLMFHYGSEKYKVNGNFWLTENNGGLKTIKALDPSTELDRLVIAETGGHVASRKYIRNNGEFRLESKYENFFNGLKYACVRTIKTKDGEREVLFSHSMPNQTVPVDEILNCSSFEAFHTMRKHYHLQTKETNLWNRKFLTEPFEKYIIVHGHTPTFYAEHFMGSISDPDNIPGYSEKAIEESSVLLTTNKSDGAVLQIDIDTGLVYGKKLSALLLPETESERMLFTGPERLPGAVSFNLVSGYHGDYIENDFSLNDYLDF